MMNLRLTTFMARLDHVEPLRKAAANQGLSVSALLRLLIAKELKRAARADAAPTPAKRTK